MDLTTSPTPRPAKPSVLETRLRGKALTLARAGWATFLVLTLAIYVVGIPARLGQLLIPCTGPGCSAGQLTAAEGEALRQMGLSLRGYATYVVTLEVLVGLVFTLTAVFIVWRRADDWMAIFVSLFLIGFGLSSGEMIDSLSVTYSLSPAWLNAVDGLWGWLPFTLFLFLFPNGRFVPRWSRWLALGWTTWRLLIFLFPESWLNASFWPPPLQLLWWAGLMWLPGIAAQLYRYARVSSRVERQQTKWVVLGVAGAGLLTGLTSMSGLLVGDPAADNPLLTLLAPEAVETLASLLIPITITLAVLRYRLWDVDPIVNRALVYGALTATIAGVYAAVVAGTGLLLQAQGRFLGSLVAAALVAVLFQPIRQRLQRAVNRLMYGQRDEPYRVLVRLGERLEALASSEAVLPAIADTVAQALKLPYAGVALRDGEGFTIVAEAGERPERDLAAWPLVYQSETVGRLMLARRSPDEPFTPADRQLLETFARQAGAAVHAVRLTADLQRSRVRLVTAREEERRRLRRDLHDGLGPVLAGQGLKLAAIQQVLPEDAGKAVALLESVMTKNEETVAEVRRLVYELRPPALDELGLVGAIRDQVVGQRNETRVNVTAPAGGLPSLPAAVEVAAYRIAMEALTNVARHAQARRCHVRFWVEASAQGRTLCLEIADDGVGLPETVRPGVGMTSMRERAEEIGGSCEIAPADDGGTRVAARLPLGE
ncbi:MAG: GAF domain-containing sensor histidine kinase [Candidatus Promineifilaceae bacterium]|nr:GAF domain-containing sensor histidine kinase [Candidatus Promineifilaceae bacterium]